MAAKILAVGNDPIKTTSSTLDCHAFRMVLAISVLRTRPNFRMTQVVFRSVSANLLRIGPVDSEFRAAPYFTKIISLPLFRSCYARCKAERKWFCGNAVSKNTSGLSAPVAVPERERTRRGGLPGEQPWHGTAPDARARV